jgi:hypothetical protein
MSVTRRPLNDLRRQARNDLSGRELVFCRHFCQRFKYRSCGSITYKRIAVTQTLVPAFSPEIHGSPTPD